MRIATLFSIAVLGLSSAVIAQVTTTPTEQKIGNAPEANDMAVAENNLAPASNALGNETAPVPNDTPDGAASNAAPPPGEPDTATSAPPKM